MYAFCFKFNIVNIYIYEYTFKIDKYTNGSEDLQWWYVFFIPTKDTKMVATSHHRPELSPSGHLVATGGTDGRVKIYEACQSSGRKPSLKLNISPPENRPFPRGNESHLPTIHFHGRTVSFREGMAVWKTLHFWSLLVEDSGFEDCWVKMFQMDWFFVMLELFEEVEMFLLTFLVGIWLNLLRKLWVRTISSSYCGNGASSRWWESQWRMFLFQPLRQGNCNVSQCSNMS